MGCNSNLTQFGFDTHDIIISSAKSYLLGGYNYSVVPDIGTVLLDSSEYPLGTNGVQFPGIFNIPVCALDDSFGWTPTLEDFKYSMAGPGALYNYNDCNDLVVSTFDAETTVLSLDSNGSFLDTSDDRLDRTDASLCVGAQREQTIPSGVVISNVSSIPTAVVLQRLQPLTVTVNLLVAVIKVEPTRAVRLRKRNVDMEIVELIVGDESRAGFAISFWLVPEDAHRTEAVSTHYMPQQLQAVRTGYISCVRNVALASHRQCVYGQSLNTKAVNVHTTVTICANHGALAPSQRAKYHSVCAWRDMFVGPVVAESNA